MDYLIIQEIINEYGDVEKIKIIKQSRRCKNFGNLKEKDSKNNSYFVHNGFVLASVGSPQIMDYSIASDRFGGEDGLFVRGFDSEDDETELSVPSQEWLEKMREAVKAYNLITPCKMCIKRNCNKCNNKDI